MTSSLFAHDIYFPESPELSSFLETSFDHIIKESMAKKIKTNHLEAKVKLAERTRKEAVAKKMKANKAKKNAENKYDEACIDVEKSSNRLISLYEELLNAKK